jgi:hypothetical protein
LGLRRRLSKPQSDGLSRVRARALIHRNARSSRTRVGLALPAVEARAKTKTCEPGHEVELGRVGVADLHRIEPNPFLTQANDSRLHTLLGGVMTVDVQPNVLESDAVHLDALIAVEARQVGYERLGDEDAVAGEVSGHVFKATDLLFLRLQAKERVENEVDERAPPLNRDIGEVTQRDGDARSARLRAKPRDHFFRGVDPADIDAAFGKGQGDAPGADGELEHGAGAGTFVQERDRCLRVEQDRRHILVVDLGDVVAVGRRSVLLDFSILGRLRPAQTMDALEGSALQIPPEQPSDDGPLERLIEVVRSTPTANVERQRLALALVLLGGGAALAFDCSCD